MLNGSSLVVVFLVALLILLESCGGTRQAAQLAEHRNFLSQISQSDLPTEAKVDSMAVSFIEMMDEGLRIVNPKKGAQYVGKFAKQNEQSIDLILAETAEWQSGMGTAKKILYGVSLASKPYAKDLIDLYPKFERKYKQVKLIMNLSKKVKDGLLSAGLKSLGLGS